MYTSIINYLEKTITLYPEKNAVIDGNKKQAKVMKQEII